MNIVFTMQVAGRNIVQYELHDQTFVPRVGDELVILSDLRPTPTVTHVQLVASLEVAYVTLSDLGAVDDAVWQAIHENLGQATPGPQVEPVAVEHRFNPAEAQRASRRVHPKDR